MAETKEAVKKEKVVEEKPVAQVSKPIPGKLSTKSTRGTLDKR